MAPTCSEWQYLYNRLKRKINIRTTFHFHYFIKNTALIYIRTLEETRFLININILPQHIPITITSTLVRTCLLCLVCVYRGVGQFGKGVSVMKATSCFATYASKLPAASGRSLLLATSRTAMRCAGAIPSSTQDTARRAGSSSRFSNTTATPALLPIPSGLANT